LEFSAALIKRRLVAKLGPAATEPGVSAGAAVAVVDLAPLLLIADDAAFVRESYLRVLGRECDIGGFVHYRELLRTRYPRRAILWQLMESAEAKATGRRYVGLTMGSDTGGVGVRWVARTQMGLRHRARRLIEFLLRVSRVEAVELKLDYLLEETARQAERSMGRVDHALYSISDKMDRYVADLVAKQSEAVALGREGGKVQERLAGELPSLRREVELLRGAVESHGVDLRRLREGHAAELAALRTVVEELSAQRRVVEEIGEAVRRLAGEEERQAADLGTLRTVVEEVKRLQRSPVFQAGPEVVVTEVDGFLLGVPAREWRLAAYYGLRGVPEPGMVRLFQSLVKPGMVVVDIGAHIGMYTLYALRQLAGHGRVHSFEPTPRTFALLRDNVQVNGFLETGVVSFDRRAVSDRGGSCEFTAYGDNSGHNTLFGAEAGGETLMVETVALDVALGEEARVDVVKIDAEGAEPLILRGMSRILAGNPEVRILMEFAPGHLRRAGIDPLEWLEELARLGLVVRRVDDVSGELLSFEREAVGGCVTWNLFLQRY
jgi:FkbM family methyltransferase